MLDPDDIQKAKSDLAVELMNLALRWRAEMYALARSQEHPSPNGGEPISVAPERKGDGR